MRHFQQVECCKLFVALSLPCKKRMHGCPAFPSVCTERELSNFAGRRVQVSAVQREFVQKLLTFPVFSKHLAAVREINNMLRRALDLREACPGDERAAAPVKVSEPLPPCDLQIHAAACSQCPRPGVPVDMLHKVVVHKAVFDPCLQQLRRAQHVVGSVDASRAQLSGEGLKVDGCSLTVCECVRIIVPCQKCTKEEHFRITGGGDMAGGAGHSARSAASAPAPAPVHGSGPEGAQDACQRGRPAGRPP